MSFLVGLLTNGAVLQGAATVAVALWTIAKGTDFYKSRLGTNEEKITTIFEQAAAYTYNSYVQSIKREGAVDSVTGLPKGRALTLAEIKQARSSTWYLAIQLAAEKGIKLGSMLDDPGKRDWYIDRAVNALKGRGK